MSHTRPAPSAQTTETKLYRFAGRTPPSPTVTYGNDSDGKARVRYDRLCEFLSAHPECVAQLIPLEDKLPNGKTSRRHLIGYRAANIRYPGDWHPEFYEVSPTANMFGDVDHFWGKAEGDVRRENTYLLKLLRKEAARRPEAAHALRSILLPDVSKLTQPNRRVFRPAYRTTP